MKKTFLVTGSTGFIGSALVRELALRGHMVHCLYRNIEKVKAITGPGISFFKGDILDTGSLKDAASGCDGVFHTAAFTGINASDNVIYDLNVKGTINVLEAACFAGAKDIVITSTAGVFGPSSGRTIDETTKRTAGFFIKYEETKALAEQKALAYAEKGLNIRIVNPTRVYGPGPMVASNSVTKMLKLYSRGRWRFLPGDGRSTGNYVYVNDVVNGHILAMENGLPGERYILGGENADFITLFESVATVTGRRYSMVRLPLSLMLTTARISEIISSLSGNPPFITRGLVKRYNHNWELSSDKAVKEIGYTITPLSLGVAETLKWLGGDS